MANYRNLDQMVCTTFQKWLQQNSTITTDIPATSIYDYYKRDINQSEVIVLNIYPLDYSEWEDTLYHTGELQLDVVVNTSFMRSNKVLKVMDIVATILSQIRQTQSEDLITYFNTYIGGLLQFGIKNRGSYRELYTEALETESRVRLIFQYEVNWLVYQNWLLSYQCDIESPNNVIYQPLVNIDYIQQ